MRIFCTAKEAEYIVSKGVLGHKYIYEGHEYLRFITSVSAL